MTTELEHPTMNEQQINDMVSRFLAWRLPENFSPDGGISFAPTFNTLGGGTARAEPVGTNLFSFDQAKQMVLHMLGEANSPAPTMRLETESENIARDMREGRFPARSKQQMVPIEPVPALPPPPLPMEKPRHDRLFHPNELG